MSHLHLHAVRWRMDTTFFTALCIFEVESPPIGQINFPAAFTAACYTSAMKHLVTRQNFWIQGPSLWDQWTRALGPVDPRAQGPGTNGFEGPGTCGPSASKAQGPGPSGSKGPGPSGQGPWDHLRWWGPWGACPYRRTGGWGWLQLEQNVAVRCHIALLSKVLEDPSGLIPNRPKRALGALWAQKQGKNNPKIPKPLFG